MDSSTGLGSPISNASHPDDPVYPYHPAEYLSASQGLLYRLHASVHLDDFPATSSILRASRDLAVEAPVSDGNTEGPMLAFEDVNIPGNTGTGEQHSWNTETGPTKAWGKVTCLNKLRRCGETSNNDPPSIIIVAGDMAISSGLTNEAEQANNAYT
ncbi:hypothetical protein IAT40_005461 [Kwoniella sp. CBS 6097]